MLGHRAGDVEDEYELEHGARGAEAHQADADDAAMSWCGARAKLLLALPPWRKEKVAATRTLDTGFGSSSATRREMRAAC